MTPAEWTGVGTIVVVLPRVLLLLESYLREKMATRTNDRPKSSVSSGQLKAVAEELKTGDTVGKVNEIHEALAGRDPFTRGYVIPEHLKTQTKLLSAIAEDSAKQTQALQRIASNSPAPVMPPRPDTRYRGGGGE